MDAVAIRRQARADFLAAFAPTPTRDKKQPRKAGDYRADRRNAAKGARLLPLWRNFIAGAANVKAKIVQREALANGAREAAAAAIVANTAGGLAHVVASVAMLEYYRAERSSWGRAVGRITAGLERDVRAAEAVRS